MTTKLVDRAASLLDRRFSRRGLLSRFAMGGSALAVAPLRYLLRPGSAWGVITCADCSSSQPCCDGWTAFCCTVYQGQNACPPYSFIAGWWKCTAYTGSGACAKEGVRYYLDCNRLPEASCPGGCHCAQDSCSKRRTCCNVFRYGQCNTHIPGVTAVVCRIIKCVNPCVLYDFCNCTYKEENAVCAHEEPCLPPYP
jgi:hypothetical protein